jgi:hypothetical protein
VLFPATQPAADHRDTEAVANALDAFLMENRRQVEFELGFAALPHPVRVKVADAGERWVASVQCGRTSTNGLAADARGALAAALAPFGARMSAMVLAAPATFGASAELLTAG